MLSAMPDLDALLTDALTTGSDTTLREALLAGSGLPGPRLNLRLVGAFGRAVATLVIPPEPVPVDALERLLDGWASLSEDEAPGDQPAVILPCAAVRAYGDVGVARPDWWDDETTKLHGAACDPRWRVREVVAQALQLLLAADWPRTAGLLSTWASDHDPLVVRAAAAAVAEPPLLKAAPDRAGSADAIQRLAVTSYQALPPEARRTPAGKALRQALAYTISVTTAATKDLTLLNTLAASDDPDLLWIAHQNLKKSRLRPLLDRPSHLRRLGAPDGPRRRR
jgi:hypothetical protein